MSAYQFINEMSGKKQTSENFGKIMFSVFWLLFTNIDWYNEADPKSSNRVYIIMGVKASPKGKKDIDLVISKRNLRFQNYLKMSGDLGISGRTIGTFVNGGGVKKSNAEKIINYLNLNRSDIIPDAEWNKGTADESVSIDERWDELYKLAKSAPLRLKMVLAAEATAGFADKGEGKYLTEIVAGSKVWIHLDVQQPGYLILLDLDSVGDITCLSPSEYVPEYRLEPGIEQLPQKTSSERVFQPATIGKEVLLAAILPEKPTFDWLKEKKCQVLDAVQLGDLLDYIKSSKKPVDLIKSTVAIVAA
jgi:hypothetical protein